MTRYAFTPSGGAVTSISIRPEGGTNCEVSVGTVGSGMPASSAKELPSRATISRGNGLPFSSMIARSRNASVAAFKMRHSCFLLAGISKLANAESGASPTGTGVRFRLIASIPELAPHSSSCAVSIDVAGGARPDALCAADPGGAAVIAAA